MQAENKGDFIISGGLGLKTKRLQMDLSYRNRMGSRNYYAFSQSVTSVNTKTHQMVASVALIF